MKLHIILFIIISQISFGQRIEIKDLYLKDSCKIKYRICYPKQSEKAKSMVLFIHGTGPNTYLNKRKFGKLEFNYYDYFAKELNKRNIIFISYNRRGVEIGKKAPYFDKIDSTEYAKYTPEQECEDLEQLVLTIRKNKELKNHKLILLGASEGTIISTLITTRGIIKPYALFMIGYAHNNLKEIIKWQYSGKSSIVNLQKYFDKNDDKKFSPEEFNSIDTLAVIGRKYILRDFKFNQLDLDQDSIITYKDFALKTQPIFNYIIKMYNKKNNKWIWNNYFRITCNWLESHFKLEANKSRMLKIDTLIFIFHGTRDGSSPVESAIEINKLFNKANKHNLDLNIFSGHDHDLNFLEWVKSGKTPKGLVRLFKKLDKISK